jgi:hypothetical protein
MGLFFVIERDSAQSTASKEFLLLSIAAAQADILIVTEPGAPAVYQRALGPASDHYQANLC